MDKDGFVQLINSIVKQARDLKDKHTRERSAPVNYAAVFSHTKEEFDELTTQAHRLGKIVKQTPTGPLFHIAPLPTAAGDLRLLKIRMPDPTRPERGDADFTVPDYAVFKKTFLLKKGFSLIQREDFEMIELMDPAFSVRAYFSNPPLDKQLGL